jgi:hypothetical protein
MSRFCVEVQFRDNLWVRQSTVVSIFKARSMFGMYVERYPECCWRIIDIENAEEPIERYTPSKKNVCPGNQGKT